MSTSPSRKQFPGPIPIPPLTSTTRDGRCYVRSEAVIAEIRMMSERELEEWPGAARYLKSETIVFLIRYCLRTHPGIAGLLLMVLSRRTIHMARLWIYGAYEAAAESIMFQVDMDITRLVLTNTVSRQTEALEIAFGQAVTRRTTNAVQKFRHTPLGYARQIQDYDEETGKLKDSIESIPDPARGPHERLFETECRELVEMASEFVTDQRHLRAVRLRYLEGWQMSRIEEEFNISTRQIQNWINIALEQMKEGLGRNGHDGA